MNQDQAVRELLRRAVDGLVPVPNGTSERIFAQARSIRRRRRRARIAVSALALAGAVTAGLLLPGAVDARRGQIAAGYSGPTQTALLRELLPPEVGRIELNSKPGSGKDVAIGDGMYLVAKGGKYGEISIHNFAPDGSGAHDVCAEFDTKRWTADCGKVELSGGRTLWTWRIVPGIQLYDDGTKSVAGYCAGLGLPDGRTMFIQVNAGDSLSGRRSDPAWMAAPPLTMAQLRDLALRPELLVPLPKS
ncbi:hypothetical protein G3I60_35305 [Streptomyces sp. SID13666]|uniref:hypothetical protein n=1 Tax=unclassified Streptomyces TaxID=2593676 RepID=UPI0013BF15CF|nr:MULTISPECIES: hypothetical protein [unclassified Streptomyces]NEA59290.1 hypothetical protein [Streptomyces sp. SID13666]NEA77018.1 hypothetical protein [Streptomyces sp. SID13588]